MTSEHHPNPCHPNLDNAAWISEALEVPVPMDDLALEAICKTIERNLLEVMKRVEVRDLGA